MTCPDCGTQVEYSGRGVLVDREGTGMRRHFCPPEPFAVEQWDICDCGERYVRINRGQKLELDSRELHVCCPVKPAAAPVRQVTVERPPTPSKLRIL